MSLKQEIETWVTALAAYDANEFDNALQCFGQIADTSKILFNLGVINATLGQHVQAVEYYQHAVQLDQYLAVAYFQQGVSNFLMGDFEEALANFNDTLLYLRGNNNIDYEQLGLKFKLHSCEVLFNRGLCYIYLQQKEAGMQDLSFAAREKRVPDHDVIDEAIREQAEGYTVFSIPVGVVYRPNEAKVKNLRTKDYLGKARLVAHQERQNTARARAALAAIAIDDRPEEKLSYAALNLVKPDLRSRSRQQSEPPLQRNIFPPTPPPEPEQQQQQQADLLQRRARRMSSESSSSNRPSGAKPMRLELGVAAFDQRTQQHQQQQRSQVLPPQHYDQPSTRIPPKRSESERPAMRRQFSDREARREEPSNNNSRQQRDQVRQQMHNVPEVRIEDDPIKPYTSETTPTSSFSSSSTAMSTPLQPHQRTKSNTTTTSTRSQPTTISEEGEEYEDISISEDSTDPTHPPPLAFEIVHPGRSNHRRIQPRTTKAPSSTVEMKKIRIKMHGPDDMRYLIITPQTSFHELEELVRNKFFNKEVVGFKLKVRDEDGDLITVGDDDDLDLAVGSVRAVVEREGAGEMGKLEMWVQQV